MNATLKKKLCWNCEGRVGLEEQNCPFCAVYLGPAPNDAGERKDDILAPHYKIVEAQEPEPALTTPYSMNEPQSEQAAAIQLPTETTSGPVQNVALPLTLLSGGLLFLVFGLILFLFSTDGVLTLRWNGSFWYIYVSLAIPLLGFGWKLIQQLDNKSE